MPPKSGGSSNAVACLVVALGALLLAGVVAVAIFVVRARSAPASAPDAASASGRREVPGQAPSPRRKPIELDVYLDDLCFLNATPDGVPDALVWIGTEARVAVVDGRTGIGVWASPAPPSKESNLPLACAPDLALVGSADFTVHAYEAGSGRERWSAKLSDAPREIVVGNGCVTVVTGDRKEAGLDLGTGGSKPCPSAPAPAPFTGHFWDREKSPKVARAGDVKVTLSSKQSGTPMLSLAADRGGAKLWAKDLGLRAPGGRGDVLLAVAAGVAVVPAAEIGRDSPTQLVGVDATTGDVLYKKPIQGGRVAWMEASGPFVYVTGTTLTAHDPRTGERVWTALAP